MNARITRLLPALALPLAISSCAQLEPKPLAPSSGHIQAEAAGERPEASIPDLARQLPILPPPAVPKEREKYTVVVNEAPVKELLFALARDANINVDIAPAISGVVTINAVEQSLAQLLERIARQVALRYEFDGGNLYILPDTPFFRTYTIDYIDMFRSTDISVAVSNQIESAAAGGSDAIAGGGGGSGSNSTVTVASAAVNAFWSNLLLNVMAIIDDAAGSAAGDTDQLPITDNVIAHPETGLLTVRATARQHEQVQAFISRALASANRQVMIQATIVEVTLSDAYQAGVNWEYLAEAGKAGFTINSAPRSATLTGTSSLFTLKYNDPNTGRDRINAAVQLLQEFGDTRVLSSPQIMALNNQTALLQVVDNIVYFQIEQETTATQGVSTSTIETSPRTVPVGITMSITPQINGNDSIILNVRPSISRITRFIDDPNPQLTEDNLVPQIQVRQMESILRLTNDQIAVLGGLMQDDAANNTNAIPGLSRIPGLGKAFEDKQISYSKTELVIFIRPLIIQNPSLDDDLQPWKRFLRTSGK